MIRFKVRLGRLYPDTQLRKSIITNYFWWSKNFPNVFIEYIKVRK